MVGSASTLEVQDGTAVCGHGETRLKVCVYSVCVCVCVCVCAVCMESGVGSLECEDLKFGSN